MNEMTAEDLTSADVDKLSGSSPIIETLDSTHRCERCGAQAWVLVTHIDISGDLLFCAHHYAHHELALIEQGFYPVLDERSKLLGSTSEVHA